MSGRAASELLDALLNEVLSDDFPSTTHFSPPTLHELYDLDVLVDVNDPNEEAVSTFFPESALLAAQEGFDLHTPPLPILESPLPEPSGIPYMPELLPEVVDLTCHEPGFPPSDDEGEPFALDYAEIPGLGCRSCAYHQRVTGDPEVKCSLCYMRLTSSFIYSKFFCVGGLFG